jgi:DNA mismatch repair protein PMS2
MELTASDELLAVENIDVLRLNGFEVEIDGDSDGSQGSRLKLTAQPISKSTVFDMKGRSKFIILFSWYAYLDLRSGRTHSFDERSPSGTDG